MNNLLLTTAGFSDVEIESFSSMEEMSLDCGAKPLFISEKAEVSEEALEKYELLESASKLNVPADFKKKVAKTGDTEAMYVVWEMPSGYSRMLSEEAVKGDKAPSKKNRNRFWSEDIMWGFAEQIRKRRPVGYNGHANFLEFGSVPDQIPVIWVAAVKARRKSDKRGVTLARAYVYPHGNTRDYITTDAIDSASVYTVGKGEYGTTEDSKNEDDKVWVVLSAELVSFDLVRKGLHGVPKTKLVAKEAISVNDKDITAEHIALLQDMNVENLTKLRPDLVEAIRGVTADASEELKTARANCLEASTETAKLQLPARLALEAADLLGCEVTGILEGISILKAAHAANIDLAVETVLAKVNGGDNLKKYVKEQLAAKASTFSTVEDVHKAAEEAIAVIRDAASMMFEGVEDGGAPFLESTTQVGKKSGVSSVVSEMQGGTK